MLSSAFRAINAVFAVVVAIVVSMRLGESNVGKLVTVVITAGVVVLFEWFMVWSPKHLPTARRLLDARAVFAGVWLQQDVHAFGDSTGSTTHVEMIPNRFAVFSLEYDRSSDTYNVDGSAYDGRGEEHARWNSVDVVHFAKDGRSMTYMWEGTITSETLALDDPRRTGFARLTLASDDAGRGRVEHVALRVNLEFNLRRVTPAWLADQKLDAFTPDRLHEPDIRDKFALALAKSLHLEG